MYFTEQTSGHEFFFSFVIVSSCDFIGVCTSADEAELRACLVGLYRCLPFTNPCVFKTDCSFVVSFLANETLDMSRLVDPKKEAFNITKPINSFKIIKIN